MLSDDSLTPTQIMMQTRDPPAPLTWNWKLRAGKEMEMAVKTDKQQWTGARDGQTTRCECSCDGEEWPMVHSLPLTAEVATLNIMLSSNAFAAKDCNTITAMALL